MTSIGIRAQPNTRTALPAAALATKSFIAHDLAPPPLRADLDTLNPVAMLWGILTDQRLVPDHDGEGIMTRKEQAAASRAELMEAARQCFAELGYEGTTVAGILKRADMARGALYHYFPGGKAEIFAAVFDMINETFHQRRDALLHLSSPVARLRAGIVVFLKLCTEDDFARIALTDAPAVVPGQGWRGSSYQLLREQVEEAVGVGEIKSLDADVTAMALYGAVRSAGECVIGADDRMAAMKAAIRALDCFIEGLRSTATNLAGDHLADLSDWSAQLPVS
jgi:AcrR family transcriptional regulator